MGWSARKKDDSLAGARGDCSEEEQMNEFACSHDGELTDDDGFNRSKSGLK